jgi:hypothetical protein
MSRTSLSLDVLRRIADTWRPGIDDPRTLAAEIRNRYGVSCAVEDLLAMSPTADPYVIDGWRVRNAEWFASVVWPMAAERFGTTAGIHLRRLHYFIANVAKLERPDKPTRAGGDPLYLNLSNDGNLLSRAAVDARALCLIPNVKLIDAKNPDMHIAYMADAPEPWVHLDDDAEGGEPSVLWTVAAPYPGPSRLRQPWVDGYEYSRGPRGRRPVRRVREVRCR